MARPADPAGRCAQIDLITDVVEELIVEQLQRWRDENLSAANHAVPDASCPACRSDGIPCTAHEGR